MLLAPLLAPDVKAREAQCAAGLGQRKLARVAHVQAADRQGCPRQRAGLGVQHRGTETDCTLQLLLGPLHILAAHSRRRLGILHGCCVLSGGLSCCVGLAVEHIVLS